jgi:hypothetical protein
MVHKILEYRWMKIGLQNAIRAIHSAKGADMQNLITATRINARSGTGSNKRAFISGKEKNCFGFLDRII